MLNDQAQQQNLLEKSVKVLREENEQLRIESDDLRAEVEILRVRVSGISGLTASSVTRISA